jgi:beta-phosphoglucomutase-like phosphatase (HAD superfamily)
MSEFRAAARVFGASNVLASLDKKPTASLVAEKNRLFHEAILATPPAMHRGCAQMIEDAQAAGCKLAVVSDMPVATATALLDQAFGNALNQCFAVVIAGACFDDGARVAPHQRVLHTVGVEADQCAAIDTAAPGLRAAQRAGIWTIAATPYEKDIARISGADMWCPQLQELQQLIDRKGTSHERPESFITLDGLRHFKRHQIQARPVLRRTLSQKPMRPQAV